MIRPPESLLDYLYNAEKDEFHFIADQWHGQTEEEGPDIFYITVGFNKSNATWYVKVYADHARTILLEEHENCYNFYCALLFVTDYHIFPDQLKNKENSKK
jgi:hypothetical protein